MNLLARIVLIAACVLTGCKTQPATATKAVVGAQTPGVVTGAGATMTGPANSGAPSTQVAEKRVAYYPPTSPRPAAPVAAPVQSPQPVITQAPPADAPTIAPTPPDPPAPAWTYERTETTLGQHQDAAGIMKAAATIGTWGTLKWIGLFCIVGAVAGLLWSAGHDQGYPLVFWKVGGCGVFFMLCGDNPFWLLLLLLPLGFYAVQKFNLLKLP